MEVGPPSKLPGEFHNHEGVVFMPGFPLIISSRFLLNLLSMCMLWCGVFISRRKASIVALFEGDGPRFAPAGDASRAAIRLLAAFLFSIPIMPLWLLLLLRVDALATATAVSASVDIFAELMQLYRDKPPIFIQACTILRTICKIESQRKVTTVPSPLRCRFSIALLPTPLLGLVTQVCEVCLAIARSLAGGRCDGRYRQQNRRNSSYPRA